MKRTLQTILAAGALTLSSLGASQTIRPLTEQTNPPVSLEEACSVVNLFKVSNRLVAEDDQAPQMNFLSNYLDKVDFPAVNEVQSNLPINRNIHDAQTLYVNLPPQGELYSLENLDHIPSGTIVSVGFGYSENDKLTFENPQTGLRLSPHGQEVYEFIVSEDSAKSLTRTALEMACAMPAPILTDKVPEEPFITLDQRVYTMENIVNITITNPVEVREVTVEVPVEREVPVYHDRITTIDREVEVPIHHDRIETIDRTVETPVYHDRITTIDREIETPIYHDRIETVDRTVEVPIHHDRITTIDREVEVPVFQDRIVEVPVAVYVDRVEIREVPIETIIEREVIREVEVPVYIEREVIREVPVEPEPRGLAKGYDICAINIEPRYVSGTIPGIEDILFTEVTKDDCGMHVAPYGGPPVGLNREFHLTEVYGEGDAIQRLKNQRISFQMWPADGTSLITHFGDGNENPNAARELQLVTHESYGQTDFMGAAGQVNLGRIVWDISYGDIRMSSGAGDTIMYMPTDGLSLTEYRE